MTSIHRNTTFKLGLAAAVLMAFAGGALAQPHRHTYKAYSAAPIDQRYRAVSPSYNPLVGPGVTTVGVNPGDRTAPVGAD